MRTIVGLLVIAGAVMSLHPSAVHAAGSPARLLRSVVDGSATVDQLVAATAARCKCAPPQQAGLAAAAGLPSVGVGSASGSAGQQVTFAVSLSTAGAIVAGVQADIAFDSINTPLAATPAGEPDCLVNPDIGKEATAFAFQPPGCTGAACTAFRAIVISFVNVDPISDGSMLYACKVNLSPSAAADSYPLMISNVGMSTPEGQAIASTGTDGAIIVTGGPSPGPTSKDQCKHGGWRNFTFPHPFKNQGDCIQFVNTGR
jgi:hypothetical protein